MDLEPQKCPARPVSSTSRPTGGETLDRRRRKGRRDGGEGEPAAWLDGQCNPMEAGKWAESYSEALRGKHVFIVPDTDRVGDAHATLVARAVHPLVPCVSMLKLPSGSKDLTAWVEAGATKEQFWQLLDTGVP